MCNEYGKTHIRVYIYAALEYGQTKLKGAQTTFSLFPSHNMHVWHARTHARTYIALLWPFYMSQVVKDDEQ